MGASFLIAWTLGVGAPEGEAGAFSWEAPDGCPDAGEMAARIEAAGGTGELVVDVVVREAEGAWEATLSIDLHGEREARVLRGESCEAVAKAAELLVAVRRDEVTQPSVPSPQTAEAEIKEAEIAEPEVAEPEIAKPEIAEPEIAKPAIAKPAIAEPETAEPEIAEPEPASVVVGEPARSGPVARDDRRGARFPTGVMLGAAAGVGIGATPAPDVPVEIAIGGSWPRFRVAARGRWYVPRRVDLSGGRSARVQVGTAGVEGCARVGVRRVEFPLCGQVAVGGSRADGGGPSIRDRAGVWAEIGLDVGVAWHLRPWWALTARLGGAAVLAGTRYVRDDEVVFDPAPIHGRLVLGVEFHVPIRSGGRPEKEGSR